MPSSGARCWRMTVLLAIVMALMTDGVTCLPLTNVALNKPTAQSSTFFYTTWLTSDKAVDGINNTYYTYCQHTDLTRDPKHWWLVALKQFYDISSVKITNRGDCCASRLKNIDIEVFMENPMNSISAKAHLCYHYNGPMGAGVTARLSCSQPTTGRYVRITKVNNGEPLHVCEVEVLAITSASANRRYRHTKGHRAPGVMIQDVTSRRVTDCLAACGRDVVCSAVNMGPMTWTSAGWRAVCQLLSFGGIGQPNSTTPDPDWHFYSTGDVY